MLQNYESFILASFSYTKLQSKVEHAFEWSNACTCIGTENTNAFVFGNWVAKENQVLNGCKIHEEACGKLNKAKIIFLSWRYTG